MLKWLDKEHVLGPFPTDHPFIKSNRHRLRLNPVFTVWKPDSDVRPVINYSKPLDDGGPSLNGRIKEGPKATVEYLKAVELIVTIKLLILIFGSCWLWAMDLDEGYYNCRVRPDQIWLLAFTFAGFIFIPMVLAMGLSSAPLIFTIFMYYVIMAMRLADESLTYITVDQSLINPDQWQTNNGLVYLDDGRVKVPLINYYLDDIFGMAPQNFVHRQFRLAKRILAALSLSAKASKDRLPAIIQIFLGIEYDVDKECCRVPEEKARRYIAFAEKVLSGKRVTKKVLFSLTGKARHMAAYCKVLTAFARGVEIHGHQHRNGKPVEWTHSINVCGALRRDIEMLRKSMMFCIHHELPWDHIIKNAANTELNTDLRIYVDAAGRHGGIGGYTHEADSRYFQVPWTAVPAWSHCDILWKEMVALYVAIKVNLDHLRNRHIGFYSDNSPVVYMLIRGGASLHRPDLQELIREIFMLLLFNRIDPWWQHVPGDDNITADRLSRFKPEPFATVDCEPSLCLNEAAERALNRAMLDSKQFCGRIDPKHLVLPLSATFSDFVPSKSPTNTSSIEQS